MNEILNLQSDLHANDFALYETYTLGIRTLLFASLLVMESRPLLTARGSLPPSFDTATFCVGVLAVGMPTCATHGSASSNGISSFFQAF